MITLKRILFILLAVVSLHPAVPSWLALLTGIVFALSLTNPFPQETKRFTPLLLQISVIGLGGSMNLQVVGAVGLQGIAYTAVGIFFTLLLGWLLGKAFKTATNTSLLISSGTAICGGSAIAAISSVIGASAAEISVSLVTVFLLNAMALFIFPPIAHYYSLTEHQFGLWSALAIHDTSSVVGASLQYGPIALQTATTMKLARALWIIPLAFIIAFIRTKGKNRETFTKMQKPWFILGFLFIAALVTWIPSLESLGNEIAVLAKRSLVLTLFLIGSGLSKEALKSVGIRPFLQGFILWVLVSSLSLAAIIRLLVS